MISQHKFRLYPFEHDRWWCLAVLRLSHSIGARSSQSVNLLTLFLGRVKPPISERYTYFRRKRTTAHLESAEDVKQPQKNFTTDGLGIDLAIPGTSDKLPSALCSMQPSLGLSEQSAQVLKGEQPKFNCVLQRAFEHSTHIIYVLTPVKRNKMTDENQVFSEQCLKAHVDSKSVSFLEPLVPQINLLFVTELKCAS